MRKSIILLILFFICGCASVTYTNPQGETFRYQRFGAQSIQGLTMKKNDQGIITITLDKNKADAGDLGKAIADLAEVAAKMSAK